MINIITSNHGDAIHVQEHFEYIRCGLTYVGENVRYSQSTEGELLWHTEGTNVLLECFEQGEMIVDLIKMKMKFPKSKLIIVLTELLQDGVFNSAKTASHGAEHYSDLAYWHIRTYNFYQLIPYIDGLVLYAEALIPGYKEFGKPIFYLPLAAPPGFAAGTHFPLQERNIDAIFSGSVTSQRAVLIERLRSRGHTVVALPSKTPEYIRNNYYARSKVVLGPKLGPDTTLLSKWRAYYALLNRHVHVFERVADSTDLDDYIYFGSGQGDFVEDCHAMIKRPELFPLNNFNRFRESATLNYVDIFLKLRHFLNASTGAWSRT